jgi:uncharacterized membrane protein
VALSEFGLGIVLVTIGAIVVGLLGQGTRGAAAFGWLIAVTLVFGFGTAVVAPLALFVLGAGALTRAGRAKKESLGAAEPNRGRRTVANVAAKLGVPAALGLLAALVPDVRGPAAIAATAALAGAFADTVATEMGPLGGGRVVVWSGRGLVGAPHGAAGGVSLAGLAAGAAAALTLAWLACLVGVTGGGSTRLVVAGSGFAATLLESTMARTRWGAAAGHHGRNWILSAAAAGLAALATWGTMGGAHAAL